MEISVENILVTLGREKDLLNWDILAYKSEMAAIK